MHVLSGYFPDKPVMPSRSLVSSGTVTFAPWSAPSPHQAYTGKPSSVHHRLPLIRHLHGLWRGVLSPKKDSMASDPRLRRVSSSINVSAPAAELTPTHSSLIRSPSSPTPLTPSSLAHSIDPGPPGFTMDESPQELCRRRLISAPGYPVLSPPTSTFCPLGATSGAGRERERTGDAATRLQDFHALVAELRVKFFDYDYDLKNEFDAQADHGKEEEENRERVVRLLEDVMRKVQQLAEKDTAGVVTEIDDAP